jgi:hypothetical protein
MPAPTMEIRGGLFRLCCGDEDTGPGEASQAPIRGRQKVGMRSAMTRVGHTRGIMHGSKRMEALHCEEKRNGAVASENSRRSRDGMEKNADRNTVPLT